MRLGKALILSGCLFLAACAGQKPAATPSPAGEEYVEVPNPGLTMGADQPATIWVPRRYVESGVPRGSEVVKRGVEKVFPSKSKDDQQPATQAPAVSQKPTIIPSQTAMLPAYQQTPVVSGVPAAVPSTPVLVKHRVVVIEIGQNGLTLPLQEQLHRCGVVLMADPAQATFLAQSATVTAPEGKSSFALRLQQEYNVNEVIFVSATDGVAPGKTVVAEVYDTMGGGLLRGFDTVIPPYKVADQAARDAAINEALARITTGVKELVPLLPWYTRISAVNGNRAYVAAGKEAGLRIGQSLKVYRSGKFMKGLGYAPGSKIGMLEVDGFVGPNGAFCVIKEGQGIDASDVVSVE